jgi:hypothetical protein
MGSHNGSNGTPLDPPLFWLDNTFKLTDFPNYYALLYNVHPKICIF